MLLSRTRLEIALSLNSTVHITVTFENVTLRFLRYSTSILGARLAQKLVAMKFNFSSNYNIVLLC